MHDPYKGIPFDLIPTRADEAPLFHIVIYVKAAIRLRHDFQAAVRSESKDIRRLPGPAPAWESDFAKSHRPDAKTPEGLAAEHQRCELEARSHAAVRGNQKLGKLLRENLKSLFPNIGYTASTGDALQVLTGNKAVLSIFHPLGVDDNAHLIRLLLKRPSGNAFYW